jgi:hypothetical protein
MSTLINWEVAAHRRDDLDRMSRTKPALPTFLRLRHWYGGGVERR